MTVRCYLFQEIFYRAVGDDYFERMKENIDFLTEVKGKLDSSFLNVKKSRKTVVDFDLEHAIILLCRTFGDQYFV